PPSTDGERRLFLCHRVALRILAKLHSVLHSADALRHRHGRRVGSRRITGHGARSRALARRAVGHSAEWIFQRLSAGRGGRASDPPESWLALDVLGWGPARAT